MGLFLLGLGPKAFMGLGISVSYIYNITLLTNPNTRRKPKKKKKNSLRQGVTNTITNSYIQFTITIITH